MSGAGLGLLLLIVSAYVVAASHDAGTWMFFAYDDRVTNSDNGKHVDIPGSTNTFQGDIKSNGDFDTGGSGNIFNGIVRWNDDEGNPKLSPDNFYNAGNPSFEAWTTWPGTLSTFVEPTCTFGTRSDIGTVTITAASPEGVYCSGTGEIQVSDQNVDGSFTFLSSGLIKINGSNFDLVPYIDGILAYTTQSSDDWGIDVSGSTGSTLTGLLFAPNSGIKFQGSNTTFCVQAAAERIQVSGSTNTFNECTVPTPSPTPTPTPSPVPVPLFTQQIAGATAPNTATASEAAGPTEPTWQTFVVIAAGLLAALLFLTPRRRRQGE